jgi:halimadienyl-diphosphate synthase
MDFRRDVYNLLQEAGPGRMMPTAYDTAWVARLAELGEPIGKQALEWVRTHQLEDGSWGTPRPYYHHDRAISTLAAVTALAKQGDHRDRARLERAQGALRKALSGLDDDPAGETIGFEMIVPTLLAEARALGAVDHQGTEVIEHLAPKRSAKLAVLPDGMIDRCVTLGFSAEMAGPDGIQLLDVENLQQSNGSVSFSPSATAYFSLYVRPQDSDALAYLRRLAADGSVPNVAPFNVFEPAWVLWNLKLAGLDDEMERLSQSHLGFLEEAWEPGQGAAWATEYAPKDSDVTSVVYEVLSHFGRDINVEAVLRYETADYFRCYELESTPSVSANIHVLSALRQAGLGLSDPAVQKVLRFLKEMKNGRPFWFDKWQASPYYATAHAIIACMTYDDEAARSAVNWILSTQNKDGSWGYYNVSTAEETAYCLQALSQWNRQKGGVADHVFEEGGAWLNEHKDPPYPPLWIGKCLYSPVLVVQSAVLSALMLVEEELS